MNYTNRNANSPTSTTQLGIAYTSATFSALFTAIGGTGRAPIGGGAGKRERAERKVKNPFCFRSEKVPGEVWVSNASGDGIRGGEGT